MTSVRSQLRVARDQRSRWAHMSSNELGLSIWQQVYVVDCVIGVFPACHRFSAAMPSLPCSQSAQCIGEMSAAMDQLIQSFSDMWQSLRFALEKCDLSEANELHTTALDEMMNHIADASSKLSTQDCMGFIEAIQHFAERFRRYLTDLRLVKFVILVEAPAGATRSSRVALNANDVSL